MALATVVGIGLSLIFKLINIIRPEESYITSSLESLNVDKKMDETVK
ncbi:Uracil transport protein (NCS2 family) (fragment) (fragment) [Xenorhabdus nematophila str. Anatoliense]